MDVGAYEIQAQIPSGSPADTIFCYGFDGGIDSGAAVRFAKAPKLKMIVTAGIGSDHTDLQAAMDRGITVAELTYCNSNSADEHGRTSPPHRSLGR